jgi:hypothetical protein
MKEFKIMKDVIDSFLGFDTNIDDWNDLHMLVQKIKITEYARKNISTLDSIDDALLYSDKSAIVERCYDFLVQYNKRLTSLSDAVMNQMEEEFIDGQTGNIKCFIDKLVENTMGRLYCFHFLTEENISEWANGLTKKKFQDG